MFLLEESEMSNYVQYPFTYSGFSYSDNSSYYKGEFKEIHTVEIATFSMFLDGFDLQGIYFEPIPLTEEWLLKFGFNKTNESKDVEWYKLNNFEVSTYNEGEVVYFVYQHLVLRHIMNVHQLQNLYFALTGTELTLIK